MAEFLSDFVHFAEILVTRLGETDTTVIFDKELIR
jgi:hypothetical protein